MQARRKGESSRGRTAHAELAAPTELPRRTSDAADVCSVGQRISLRPLENARVLRIKGSKQHFLHLRVMPSIRVDARQRAAGHSGDGGNTQGRIRFRIDSDLSHHAFMRLGGCRHGYQAHQWYEHRPREHDTHMHLTPFQPDQPLLRYAFSVTAARIRAFNASSLARPPRGRLALSVHGSLRAAFPASRPAPRSSRQSSGGFMGRGRLFF